MLKLNLLGCGTRHSIF